MTDERNRPGRPTAISRERRLRADLERGSLIARLEFARSVRRVRGDRNQLLALGITAVLGFLLVLLALPAVYERGVAVREGRASVVTGVRHQVTLLAIGLCSLFAFRTVTRLYRIDREPLVLTATSSRAVVLGLLGAELARVAANVGPAALLLLGAFVLGAGAPVSGVVIPLVLLPVVLSAAVCGYLVGLGVRYVGRSLPGSSRAKTMLWPLLFALLFIGSQVLGRRIADEGLSVIIGPLEPLFAVSPITAYGDLLFLGSPLRQPIRPQAGLVALGFVCSVPLGIAVATRLAQRLWIADPEIGGSPGRFLGFGSGERGRSEVPRPFRWTTSGRIAWWYLVRASRSPGRMIHLVVPLLLVASSVVPMVEAGGLARDVDRLLRYGTMGSPVVGALFGGAALCLNPLGDDERMLPVLVLVATDPRRLVGGRVLAALVVGFPLSVLGPLVLGLVGPASSVATLCYAALGATLTVASGGIGVGLGATFPRYGTTTAWGVDTVVPSTIATIGHPCLVGLLGVVGVLLLPTAVTARIAIFGGYLLVLLSIARGGVGHATRRLRSYRLD